MNPKTLKEYLKTNPYFLKHLLKKSESLAMIISIFTKSWMTGNIPGYWRKANIMPVFKKKKEKKKSGQLDFNLRSYWKK